MILAADIGGTKTILALYQSNQEGWSCASIQTYASADFESFDRLLDEFLGAECCQNIQAACFGVAGPVINGDCQATNLPWRLDREKLVERLGTENIRIVNDLEASAWGILDLPEQQFVELNTITDTEASDNIAVIAAGTGLGEAILCRNGKDIRVLATEGGHTDFGPNSDQEIELLKYLRKKYQGHVSVERLISGEGIYNIYLFLRDSGAAPESEKIKLRMESQDRAAIIGEAAVANEDVLCIETMRLFCKLYGSEAANLALKCLPFGGVFLAGGIAPKILPCLQDKYFMQGFLDKGRYAPLLQKIPVRVCLNQQSALQGAFSYALRVIGGVC